MLPKGLTSELTASVESVYYYIALYSINPENKNEFYILHENYFELAIRL